MVFADRAAYRPVIKELREAGLEDPFEERPEIKAYVRQLFEQHRPRSEKEKAILIFRAVIPDVAEFRIEGKGFFYSAASRSYGSQTYYYGLSRDEGGLNISYNDDFEEPFRRKFGDLLPAELMGLPSEDRYALCLEYGNLLVSLLRAAGIEAGIKYVSGHAYAIAKVEGNWYQLEATNWTFLLTKERPDNDLAGVVRHYFNEQKVFFAQGLEEKAFEAGERILEMDPGKVLYWNSLGRQLAEEGKVRAAYRCFRRILDIMPENAMAWNNIGILYVMNGKKKKALDAFDNALKFDPQNLTIIRNRRLVMAKLASL
jgi:tetratricopeptide (TPR) repeat protein